MPLASCYHLEHVKNFALLLGRRRGRLVLLLILLLCSNFALALNGLIDLASHAGALLRQHSLLILQHRLLSLKLVTSRSSSIAFLSALIIGSAPQSTPL